MYKVLIVDDEKMIRMGIKKVIPWGTLEVSEVFTAASAKEALKILNKQTIDIMVTDINMSEMTGLELIREAREGSFDIRIIVLTGYDHFEYARECLRMRVEEFFLKPIDENVLAEAIKKQVGFLKRRKEIENSKVLRRRIQGTSEQLELENMMKKFINNNFEQEEMEGFYLKYHYEKDLVLQIAIIIPELHLDGGNVEEDFIGLSIKNISMGMIDSGEYGITFTDDNGAVVIAFLNGRNTEEIIEHVGQLSNILKSECNINPKIIMGNTVTGFSNLKFSYNDALYLLNNETDNICAIIQPQQSHDKAKIFKEVYDELKKNMNMNIDDMEYILKTFKTFSKATTSYNLTVNDVRRYCFEIASSVYFSYVSSSGENIKEKLGNLLKSIMGANRDEVYEITAIFLKNMLGDEQTHSHDTVNKAKRYINESLADELSVSSVAAKLFITPNYFSRLFKRITGEGCNEYITRKRVEKAKILLETTNIQIHKIADMVGYHDTNYFSLAFKKYTGASPTKYRFDKRK
ncbi:MAG TPA: response regulator [Clostridiales bacterium]|nr:response regulator [Clostridiales bacterium]